MRKIIVLSLLFIFSGCISKVDNTCKQDIDETNRTSIQYKSSNPFSNEVYIWENWQQSPIRIQVK